MRTIELSDLDLVSHCCEWTIYHKGWDDERDEDDFPNPDPDENDLVENVTYMIPGRRDDIWTDFRGMSLNYLNEDDDDLVDVDWEDYEIGPLEWNHNLQHDLVRRFGESMIYNQEDQTITYDETEVDESDLFEVEEDVN